jgi:ubiquinone/menaquinone biosynthesis C-methylase UbiE
MGLRKRLRAHVLDWTMRSVNELRAEALAATAGDVLEVGFGTGLNLSHYPPGVTRLLALDPNVVEGLPALEERLRRVAFPVERCALRADGALPFDTGRFDCVVTTWALCSIPDPIRALAEMRRVLKPGGRYLFIEHGCAPTARTAWWQDRLNPVWHCIADGCNMNRAIDRLVVDGGFELATLDRFRHRGPGLLAHMYRGVATPST